jgi:hypothetical protein
MGFDNNHKLPIAYPTINETRPIMIFLFRSLFVKRGSSFLISASISLIVTYGA